MTIVPHLMALVCHPPIQKIILSGDRGEDEQTIKVTGVTCETASHFVGTALRYVAGTPFLGPSIALRAVLTFAFKNLSHAQQEVNTSACIHAVRIELSVHSYNRAILRSHWASYMCTTNLPLQQSERSAALHSLAAPTSATAAKSGGAGGRPGQQSTRSLLTVFSPTSRQQLLRSSSDNVLRSKLLESLNNSAAFAASVLVEDARE